MDDYKEVKRLLKDAATYLNEARNALPSKEDVCRARLKGALATIAVAQDHVAGHTTIKVDKCSRCPFMFSDRTGIFEHFYCTIGLYNGTDWRQFTMQELAAGWPLEVVARNIEAMHYPARCPGVPPQWCELRGHVVTIHKPIEETDETKTDR